MPGLGRDTVDGGDGNDYIDGEMGSDNIIGGNGDDRLDVADGNDSINGGNGLDTLVTADFSAETVDMAIDNTGARLTLVDGTTISDVATTLLITLRQ